MLGTRENDRLTRVGPGTPMGELIKSMFAKAAVAEDAEALD